MKLHGEHRFRATVTSLGEGPEPYSLREDVEQVLRNQLPDALSGVLDGLPRVTIDNGRQGSLLVEFTVYCQNPDNWYRFGIIILGFYEFISRYKSFNEGLELINKHAERLIERVVSKKGAYAVVVSPIHNVPPYWADLMWWAWAMFLFYLATRLLYLIELAEKALHKYLDS
jgi:hypothetical protein